MNKLHVLRVVPRYPFGFKFCPYCGKVIIGFRKKENNMNQKPGFYTPSEGTCNIRFFNPHRKFDHKVTKAREDYFKYLLGKLNIDEATHFGKIAHNFPDIESFIGALEDYRRVKLERIKKYIKP
jgi:hypothetical protein